MGKIELSITNPFATKSLRVDRKPTVFNRALAKLSSDGMNPGKIIPIFIYIDDEYKMFGIITLNTGGTVSFFPDFYNLDNFDHLTLGANFIEKKGYLTKVKSNTKHSKYLHLEASPLTGGYYHLITFAMEGGDLLMDAPPQIELPVIEYNSETKMEKFNAWINDSISAGHCKLKFPNANGFYCIQMLVLPKGASTAFCQVNTSHLEMFLSSPSAFEKEIISQQVIIPTPEKSDFSICILTFKVDKKLNAPFGFSMSQDSIKPLPEDIEIH